MAITQDGVQLGVSISELAATKIKYFAEKQGIKENVGVRVAVKGGGCSGLTYDLQITDKEVESDKIVEQHGGTIEFFSAVGEGTTVLVRLPLRHQVEAAA